MDKNSLPNRLRHAREEAAIVCNAFADLVARRWIFDPLRNSAALADAYDRTNEANALLRIRMTLYLDLLRESFALIADDRTDVASLKTLMSRLGDEALVEELKREYSKPIPVRNSQETKIPKSLRDAWEAEEILASEVKFWTLLSDTKVAWDNFSSSVLYHTIGNCRNKVIAHKGITSQNGQPKFVDLKSLGLKWGMCEEFIALAEPIASNCGLIFRGTDYNYESTVEVFRKLGDSFWRTCKGPVRRPSRT
jgi:hypothetical protein